ALGTALRIFLHADGPGEILQSSQGIWISLQRCRWRGCLLPRKKLPRPINSGRQSPIRVWRRSAERAERGKERQEDLIMAISAGDAAPIANWWRLHAGTTQGATDTATVASHIRRHWGCTGTDANVIALYGEARGDPDLVGLARSFRYPAGPLSHGRRSIRSG